MCASVALTPGTSGLPSNNLRIVTAASSGDAAALDAAVTIRKLFDGKPLVPGVKATLAHIHNDPAWARVAPPLAPFGAADRASAVASYDAARARRVA